MKITIDTDDYLSQLRQAMLHKFADGLDQDSADYKFIAGMINVAMGITADSDEDTFKEFIMKSSIDGLTSDHQDNDTKLHLFDLKGGL